MEVESSSDVKELAADGELPTENSDINPPVASYVIEENADGVHRRGIRHPKHTTQYNWSIRRQSGLQIVRKIMYEYIHNC